MLRYAGYCGKLGARLLLTCTVLLEFNDFSTLYLHVRMANGHNVVEEPSKLVHLTGNLANM